MPIVIEYTHHCEYSYARTYIRTQVEIASHATRYISHNEPPSGTYTRVYGHCWTSGVRDGTDRAVGVASVMLQVQCISLPKRFVPSVSKCPSVVRSALTSPSAHPCFSLFLSRFVSQSVRFLCSLNLFPALRKRRANVPLLLPHAQLTRTHTRAVSMLAPKLSALHQRNSDELA